MSSNRSFFGRNKKSLIFFLVGLVFSVQLFSSPLTVFAVTGSPTILGHQGRLLDSSGNLLGGSSGTNYCFRFSFYDDQTVGGGDNQLWPVATPSTMTVEVTNGIFNAGIGDTGAGSDALDFDFNSTNEAYLNIEVADSVSGSCGGVSSFENLSPRQRITSAGYAINSNTVGGFAASQTPTANEVVVLDAVGDLNLAGNVLAGGLTLTLGSDATGDMYYRNAGGEFERLPIGTNGQALVVSSGLPSWATLPGGGDALVANPLSQFAATTSLQLAGVISNETGSGALVFGTSPTLTTPNIGAATATTINGLTISSSTGTLAITNGKTLTASNTLTLAGTDGSTLDIGTGGTLGSAAFTASGAYAPALGSDDNYVTDAQLVVIGNTSGTNTGDQTNITGSAATVTTAAQPAITSVGTLTGLTISGTQTIGTNGGTGGQVTLNGATSGAGILKVATTAGSNIVFQLPSTNGSSGNILSTDGAGVTSWISPATGTVTAVSVASANGISGSSSGGATPALTIALGAITPTTVNGITLSGASTPTLAVTGTSTISGINTGDQTTISGNAGTATALAANPDDCGANAFATTIAANGNLTCASISDADVPNDITVDSATLAGTVTVVDSTDATSFIGIYDAATGSLAPKTDGALTYDATTGALSATSFVGAFTGSATDLNCTDCINATEIEDIYTLNSGDTITGALTINDNNGAGSTLVTIGDSNDADSLAIFGDLTVTGGDITLGTTSIFSGGDTASLNNIDAIDATTETTFEGALDTLANLTSIQGQSVTITGTTSLSGTNTGDQTSVSGNAGTVTFADAAGDTTTFLALGTSATGSLAPATDAGLSYNATTDALTAASFVGGLTGNASTATALAANPDDCGANAFATTIAANGNLTCASISDADVPNDITVNLASAVTNATLTTALTVNTGTVTLTGNAANTSVLTLGAGASSISGSHSGTSSGTNTGDQTITLTGDVTGSGTGSFAATIADNSVDGGDIAIGSDSHGDVMYYNGTDWVRLAAGTSGQFLKTQGAGANVVWDTPTGSGDITDIGNCATGACFTGASGTILTFDDADGDQTLTYDTTNNEFDISDDVNITGTLATSGGLTIDGTTETNIEAAIELQSLQGAVTDAQVPDNITITNLSGTNTGDQTITLTGDVTGSGTGSFAATIAANSVALGTDTTGNYVLDVVAANGLTGDVASEGGTANLAVGAGTGITVNANDVAVNQATNFAWTGLQTFTNTITDDGAQGVYNLTLGADANTDTVSGIQISATSANTGDADTLYGVNIANLASADATVVETALRVGSGWDNIFDLNGTLLTATELGRLDGKDAALVDVNDAVATAITGTGALDAGSITSGFGAINLGTDNFTTTGIVSTDTLTLTNTGTLNGLDAIDATGEATLEATLDLQDIAGAITDGQVPNNITVDLATLASSVTNATLTTALTVNTGTVTLTGNVANTSALTIGAGAVSVSGSNTGDQTITLTGDVTGSGTGSFAATIAADSVALGTDTTGNYVSTLTAGAGLTGSASSEGATPTLAVVSGNGAIVANADDITLTIAPSADALSANTSSGSGMEVVATGLALLQGCAANEILKWSEASDVWACAADATGGGAFDSTTVDNTTWSDNANASNVWTFDVSGTDHTMTFGNGLVTFSNGVTVTGVLATSGGLTIDATTESNIETALDTLSNVTTVGALNAGSITSGFGAIDIGADNFTTTGTVDTGQGANELYDMDQNVLTSSSVAFNDVTLTNTGLHLLDTNASHDLIIAPGSNLTADHTLTITTGDADRTLTLAGDATISGTNTGDNATNSQYASDYRLANFVAGTDYLTPTGSAALLTSFPTLNQSTSGNAATATALAANPSDCGANAFATIIAANGNLTCASISDGDVPDNITVNLAAAVTNATLTTALTVNTGTVTLTGNAANTSVLTLGAGASSISGSHSGTSSGTNTGDQTITLSGDVSGSGTTGITATIGSDKILESMLKAVDAAGDEECLTYESTAGDFEWQSCGAAETDTLASVTGRGATTSTASSFTGGATIRGLTVDTATATDDLLAVSVTAGGAARFTGTITNTDLTGDRTYTLPNASITVNAAGDISGTTLASNVVTSSLTTVGALDAGSITANFGAINLGTDNFTTTGIVSTDTLTLTGTGTLNGLDAIDATGEATLEAALELQDIAGAVTDGQVPDNITVTTAGTASDLSCTDCINATEIEDIYVLNSGDTITGAFTINDNNGAGSTLLTVGDANDPDSVQIFGDLTVTGGDITLGTTSIFSGGDTASLNNIDAIDATTESTIEAALDTLSNVTTVGTLTGGATGAGFTVNFGTSTLSGNIGTGNVSGLDISDDTNLAAGAGLTLTGDSVAVASGNGAIVANADDITLTIAPSADALSANTSSGSGMEVVATGLALLQGCAANEILKWSEASDVWACAADATGGGGFDSTTVDNTTWSDNANASNVWTFDVSGTDHTMTFGNGLVTFSNGVTVTGVLATSGGLTIDATTESNIETALDTLSNVTTVGALNAGSITSGFGAIDVGADNITTTGIVSTDTLTLTNTGTLNGLDAIDATGESTLEAALDLGGDATGTLATLAVTDDSHNHTTTTISGLDISDDTNLTAGDGTVLTGDDVAVDLKTVGENGVGSIASVSGMEFESGQLSLLQGCADNEILKWDETDDDWNCEADATGGGGGLTVGGAITSGSANRILFEDASNLLAESVNFTYDGTTLAVATSSTTASNKALNISQTGATSGTDYGGYFSNTGAATTNVGLYTTASGGTTNLGLNVDAGQVLIGGTALTSSTLAKLNIVSSMSSTGSTTAIAGVHGEYTINPSGGGTQVGNRFVLNNAPTSSANTAINQIIRSIDNTALANTVRGLEVVSSAGSNTAGTNTGIRSTGATFGGQFITTGLAGGVSLPAGLYAENTGTTQGDVARFYTGSMTSATAMLQVYHDTSAFTGDALLMDMAVSGGATSFTGDFLDFKNASVQKFKVTSAGVVSMGLSGTASTNAVCSSLANATSPTAGTAYEIRDCNAAPAADYAEMYPVESGIEFGDIVVTGSEMVNTYDTTDGEIDWTKIKGTITRLVKSNESYQGNVIGIVSDNYGDFTSAGHNIKNVDNPMPIALNGRVPVKVSNTSEPISAGDYITTSSELGKAQKAVVSGQVIGKALENWSPNSGKETVMVFVGQGYYSGSDSGLAGLPLLSGPLAFDGDVTFNAQVEFKLPPLFNSDTGGFAVIKQGDRRVVVTFDNPYIAQPAVNVSMSFEDSDNISDDDADDLFDFGVQSLVVDKSQTGFTILLNKNAPRDLKFSWSALAIKDAKIYESVVEGLVFDVPTENIPPSGSDSTGDAPTGDSSSGSDSSGGTPTGDSSGGSDSGGDTSGGDSSSGSDSGGDTSGGDSSSGGSDSTGDAPTGDSSSGSDSGGGTGTE